MSDVSEPVGTPASEEVQCAVRALSVDMETKDTLEPSLQSARDQVAVLRGMPEYYISACVIQRRRLVHPWSDWELAE